MFQDSLINQNNSNCRDMTSFPNFSKGFPNLKYSKNNTPSEKDPNHCQEQNSGS